ncbi:hypothetical protein F5Y12DRAFT_587293 [Xylaria sp. FL1777]|nr:hypothetical protein F5Y12DRAFT_587293 [Xylaria sp. FL1777]
MMSSQTRNLFGDGGTDTSNNGRPLFLDSRDATDENGSIQGLRLDDFGTTALDLSKPKEADNSQNGGTLRYRSIFATGGALSSAVPDDRDTFRAARSTKGAIPNTPRFHPYVGIKDRKVRVQLTKIAADIEYLDRGFAEYFQTAGYSDDRKAVSKLLDHARESVQRRKPSSCSYTGELGKFCESVLATWECTSETTEWVEYRPRLRSDQDKIEYLQDALEIPYWEFMIKSFMDWRHSHPNYMSANGILYALTHATVVCRRKIRKINEGVPNLDPKDQAAVQVVIEGIEQRLELLDSVLFGTTIDLEDLNDDLINEPPTRSETGLTLDRELIINKSSETSTLIGLVFGFLILSTTFFCKGFAISWAENKTGSFADADFWYLCQSNVMFVLGSLETAMPLLKHHSLERTRTIFWLSFAVGVITAITSIAIYTYVNTCYSALVAFLGSIASAGSLLVLTQATTQEPHGRASVRGTKLKVRRNKVKEL